jgi:predicted ATPase
MTHGSSSEVEMITSIQFQHFRALRDTTLPLGPFTLIVGPNGSGKSTAMQSFRFFSRTNDLRNCRTVGLAESSEVKVNFTGLVDGERFSAAAVLDSDGRFTIENTSFAEAKISFWRIADFIKSFRVFSFDANAIAAAVRTSPNPQLGEDGSHLAAVLDGLRDSNPDKLEEMNAELNRWLPEFDRILLTTPEAGKKSFLLRTSVGQHRLPASELSQGVLLALAFLAVVYLPNPPSIVCFEEPDRGIHPRLLVHIQEAMYRLAFPENYGEKRQPVQVLATTHSPYLLDLYKEHPEQIVIAHKDSEGVHFERLSEKPHLTEILEGAPLGDIWFSGILGGVPAAP